jgi:hypothetical protein
MDLVLRVAEGIIMCASFTLLVDTRLNVTVNTFAQFSPEGSSAAAREEWLSRFARRK